MLRYPQLFALQAILRRLDQGLRSGIIWHTQGSGKTALSFHAVRLLTDYYARQGVASKFYFIVDRLDLMQQASREMHKRGLEVRTVSSRKEMVAELNNYHVVEGSGRPEIVVVNIQKFVDDREAIRLRPNYAIRLQRIFFIDEAHRGYNPKGSFLANLFSADPDAVRIALTGTPLLDDERATRRVFGDYIHTYYYNRSIADGFTLKLMREEIEVSFKQKLEQIFDRIAPDINIRRSDWNGNVILTSDALLNPVLDYVEQDLHRLRVRQADDTLAGMIVCETNEQARYVFAKLQQRIEDNHPGALRAHLILHDEDDKETRKQHIAQFKDETSVDLLVVNAMLLTGFDAPRLKKLYLLRKIYGHNLLQALTRVNRPYHGLRYGYVVDFANIERSFAETNNLYLQELNRYEAENNPDAEIPEGEELPPMGETLMLSDDEVQQRIASISDITWRFDLQNAEEFRKQIDQIEDRDELRLLRTALHDARCLDNQIRAFGNEAMRARFETLDIARLPRLIGEVDRRVESLSRLQDEERRNEVAEIIREALSLLEVEVSKVGEGELQMVYNQLMDTYQAVHHQFSINIDNDDEAYRSLSEHFRAFMRKHGFVAHEVKEAKESLDYMNSVMAQIKHINQLNAQLQRKYRDDERYVRMHKRLNEENSDRDQRVPPARPIISLKEQEICRALNLIRDEVEEKVYYNEDILNQTAFFEQTVMHGLSHTLTDLQIPTPVDDKKTLRNCIVNEYMRRYA